MKELMKTIQGYLLKYTSPLLLSHFPVAISRAGNGVYSSDSHTVMLFTQGIRGMSEMCILCAQVEVSATTIPGCENTG